MATLDAVKNFGKVTVNTGYDSNDTEITLSAGHGARLPDPSSDGEFNLVWWNATDYSDPADAYHANEAEIVRCLGRSADVLSISRGWENTTPRNHNTGGKTYKMALVLTAKTMGDLGSEADNETPSGTINGTNDTFTLAHTPDPQDSLKLFSNGAFQTAGGEDYALSGNTITFESGAIPLTGSVLRAFYKYQDPSTSTSSSTSSSTSTSTSSSTSSSTTP